MKGIEIAEFAASVGGADKVSIGTGKDSRLKAAILQKDFKSLGYY